MPKLKETEYDYLKENIEMLAARNHLRKKDLYDAVGDQTTFDRKMDNPETLELREIERLMMKFGIHNKKSMAYMVTKHDWGLPE